MGNMHGLFLHVLCDALGSIGVIISSAIYVWTDWKWRYLLDPSVSVFICIIIIFTSWNLLRRSSVVLLGQIPQYIDIQKVESDLNEIKNIKVEAFHIFMLAEGALMGFCYCDIPRVKPDEIHNIFNQIRKVFDEHY